MTLKSAPFFFLDLINHGWSFVAGSEPLGPYYGGYPANEHDLSHYEQLKIKHIRVWSNDAFTYTDEEKAAMANS
jgi:hypothetical protein